MFFLEPPRTWSSVDLIELCELEDFQLIWWAQEQGEASFLYRTTTIHCLPAHYFWIPSKTIIAKNRHSKILYLIKKFLSTWELFFF